MGYHTPSPETIARSKPLVLAAAARRGGHITVAQVEADCGLYHSLAQAVVRELRASGELPPRRWHGQPHDAPWNVGKPDWRRRKAAPVAYELRRDYTPSPAEIAAEAARIRAERAARP